MAADLDAQQQGQEYSFRLENPHLEEDDYLYHLGITSNDNLEERFQDVKFVCMGGKPSRMRNFAELLYVELKQPINCEFEGDYNGNINCRLKDLAWHAGRYSAFKVGPVLSVSHGVGSASLSVVLHEILKLVHHAKCTDVTFIRIGTSGGLGLNPGTVVITEQAYNSLLEPYYCQVACGQAIKYNSAADAALVKKIAACAHRRQIPTAIGNTMAADDFYEEQGRLDGALCSFSAEDKMQFLKRAHDEYGIKNMEMESACFVATCNRAKVKSAVVCVTLVNRLLGDTVTCEIDLVKRWEQHPQEVVVEFVKSSCNC